MRNLRKEAVMANLRWRATEYTLPEGWVLGNAYTGLGVGLDYNGFTGAKYQPGGDLIAFKGDSVFAVMFLPIGGQKYWAVMACSGPDEAEADSDLDVIENLIKEDKAD
jgi:hypothetical protein